VSAPASARSLAARKAAATRSRRREEARLLEKEKRERAARDAIATMERERAAGALHPSTDVERAVVGVARAALVRARSRGLPYDVDLPRKMLQICREQGGRCALSGLPFSLAVMGAGAAPHPLAPSVDRIDSAGGYTAENTRLIAWAVNCFCGVWGSAVALELARGMIATAAGGLPPGARDVAARVASRSLCV
jgi:hypothetical protein